MIIIMAIDCDSASFCDTGEIIIENHLQDEWQQQMHTNQYRSGHLPETETFRDNIS